MEEQKQKSNYGRYNQRHDSQVEDYRRKEGYKKAQFWQKVKEVRYEHRDRSKDQETLGVREDRHQKVPLNKQLGFKSRLRIGHTNPSKRINQSQPQRTDFNKHKDGTPCVQADQMKLKHLIDLTEVQCQGFDKIIHAKKGWSPMVTRLTTIVCCPSTKSKLEKALVIRLQDREDARRKGMQEWDLWTEKQQNHWREINESWQHEDMIPGKHIQEETMEVCVRQIEEVQFCEQRIAQMILPPIVLNDKGITQLERNIGATNWKIENGRFWRESQDVQSVIIPISCQSILKNCRNWVIIRITKKSGKAEIYDTRKNVGSLAIVQKYLSQLNQMVTEIHGKEFQAQKIICKPETNQVRDPEDCGLMAILILNHLALELQGEPIFQIFSNDWTKMQRYYLLFNLEIGYMRMEIGKSGIALEEKDMDKITDKRNQTLWQEENGSQQTNFNTHVDAWDELVQDKGNKSQLEQFREEQEGNFSEMDRNPIAVEDSFTACKADGNMKGGEENQEAIKQGLSENLNTRSQADVTTDGHINRNEEGERKAGLNKEDDMMRSK
ncbi:hypothetical protein OXYTRIMIC_058 [Oxytricha trifallax]|uniref:Uncharacterized protein n=1 Tax=Oxytricha trifallax TaxID=1172189 RepID=A0A073HZ35_9SPIT|nr:hypothetical protein OXYTRIMIC_058 [Oxytricha trifallax]